MKKLLLVVGLVVLYSFNSFGDEFDDKLKRKYEELQNMHPSGEELYCRWYSNEGGVIWDIHDIYYVVEKIKAVSTGNRGGHQDVPNENVCITQATICE